MFKLTVSEMFEFEEMTGVPFSRVAKQATPRICKVHRLQIGSCSPCADARGLCQEHTDAFQYCDECEGSNMPFRHAMAVVWLKRRRLDPDLAWDDFVQATDGETALRELGNE